jgi:hypothetical protein
MLIKAKTLIGYKLHSRDGEFGSVREFYFDDKHWAVRYLVAETGSWLAGRQVLISPLALLTVDAHGRSVSVALTKKQIEDSPPLESHKPVSRQFEESFHGYYGWPMYWGGPYMWGSLPYIPSDLKGLNAPNAAAKGWDAHLRSTRDMDGHTIKATDGEIGHVIDFVIDDQTWAIRYLLVATGTWWTGKTVLISPHWIEGMDWSQSQVSVSLTRAAVRLSPEYDEKALVTRDYEEKLHGHYKRQAYWTDETAHK